MAADSRVALCGLHLLGRSLALVGSRASAGAETQEAAPTPEKRGAGGSRTGCGRAQRRRLTQPGFDGDTGRAPWEGTSGTAGTGEAGRNSQEFLWAGEVRGPQGSPLPNGGRGRECHRLKRQVSRGPMRSARRREAHRPLLPTEHLSPVSPKSI